MAPEVDPRSEIELATLRTGVRPSLKDRGVEPSDREVQGADWDNARRQFPSVKMGTEEWAGFFDQRPDVMLAILGDIYRETKAQEARDGGRATIGRRPRHINGNMQELHDMITPRYSVEPFAVAVKELIGDRSLRAFAAKVPMNHHTLTRLMRGELPLEKWRLEAIAKAGKVAPSFFAEWRVMYVAEALEAAFLARPNLSIKATRTIQEARR